MALEQSVFILPMERADLLGDSAISQFYIDLGELINSRIIDNSSKIGSKCIKIDLYKDLGIPYDKIEYWINQVKKSNFIYDEDSSNGAATYAEKIANARASLKQKEDKKNKLTQNNTTLNKEIEAIKKEVDKLTNKRNDLRKEYKTLEEEIKGKEKEKKNKTKVKKIKSLKAEVKSLNTKIKKKNEEAKKKSAKIKVNKKKIKDLDSSIKTLKNNINNWNDLKEEEASGNSFSEQYSLYSIYHYQYETEKNSNGTYEIINATKGPLGFFLFWSEDVFTNIITPCAEANAAVKRAIEALGAATSGVEQSKITTLTKAINNYNATLEV